MYIITLIVVSETYFWRVDNIRSYYDSLVWMETRAHPMLVTMVD